MNWIFGYGSLIWRPAFNYSASRKAALRGWRRRFWQASPDHRGIPTAPGRVVTLVRDPQAVCWGMAYQPPTASWQAIIDALDERERNGYARLSIDLEFEDGTCARGVTYIAPPDNPSFVGPAPVADMAAQIASAVGPSGANLEYLLKLAETLDQLGVHDEEVHALHAILRGPAAP